MMSRGICGLDADDRVVLVLGNGASISEMQRQSLEDALPDRIAQAVADAGHPLRTQEQNRVRRVLEEERPGPFPPSDASFLQALRRDNRASYNRLRGMYRNAWAGSEPFRFDRQRMEQLFNAAYLRSEQTDPQTEEGQTARKLYDEVILVLRNTVNQTTKCARPQQHEEILNRLLKAQCARVSLASFNYDALMDRALLFANKSGATNWTYRDGYGFTPDGLAVPPMASEIQVWKLHGSINWYIPQEDATRATAFNPDADIYIPAPPKDVRADRCCWSKRETIKGRDTNQSVFPLMVPPVAEKTRHIHGVLSDLWSNTLEALSEATLVIVWGYSFPELDHHAAMMFSAAARRSKFNLIYINPDNAAFTRATDLCGHAWTRWFFNIQDFLAFVDNGWQGRESSP